MRALDAYQSTPPTLAPWYPFVVWSDLVRGILVSNGYADPYRAATPPSDSVPVAVGNLLSAWHRTYGSTPLTGREVVAAFESELVALAWGPGRVVGYTLRKYNGVTTRGLRLMRAPGRRAAGNRWVVQRVDNLQHNQ